MVVDSFPHFGGLRAFFEADNKRLSFSHLHFHTLSQLEFHFHSHFTLRNGLLENCFCPLSFTWLNALQRQLNHGGGGPFSLLSSFFSVQGRGHCAFPQVTEWYLFLNLQPNGLGGATQLTLEHPCAGVLICARQHFNLDKPCGML